MHVKYVHTCNMPTDTDPILTPIQRMQAIYLYGKNNSKRAMQTVIRF